MLPMDAWVVWGRWLPLALLLAALGAASGCASQAAQRQKLRSANPLDRARAAVAAAGSHDPIAIQSLVDLLEDSDDVIRMYGIIALRRICGETLGYEYHAPEADRTAAVQRWRDAIRAGTVRVRGDMPHGATAEESGAALAAEIFPTGAP